MSEAPASVPQTPVTPDSPPFSPAPVSPPAPRRTGSPLWFIMLLVVVAAVAGGWWWGRQQSGSLSNSPTTPTTSPTVSGTPEVSPATSSAPQTTGIHKLVYLDPHQSIGVFDPVTNTAQQAIKLVAGKSVGAPIWVTASSFMYSQCDAAVTGSNYQCQLLQYDLTSKQTTTLLTTGSYLNENNYPQGAHLIMYRVSHDGKWLAYLREEQSQNGKLELRLRNLSTADESLIASIPRNPGRGGAPDDYSVLAFSPDDKKLLLNFTSLLPMQDGNTGSLYVYDLANAPSVSAAIWQKPNAWLAFAHWLGNNTLIAKQVTADKEELLTLAFPNQSDSLVAAKGWYDVRPLDDHRLLYWENNGTTNTGITVRQYDLTTKQSSLVAPQIMVMAVIDGGHLLVRNLEPCGPDQGECPFSYNGYVFASGANATAVLNLTDKSSTPVTLGENVWANNMDVWMGQ